MDLIFYTNASDPETIGKSLTAVTTLSGYLKNDCDVINPRIVVENTGMVNANYCYIAEFGRYYYIDRQTILSNNRVTIEMSVDVLESFKTQIKALSCIVDNSTQKNDNYLQSDIWTNKVKTKTDIVQFPSGLNNDGEFILITAGG